MSFEAHTVLRICAVVFGAVIALGGTASAEDKTKLPAPAKAQVDFVKHIQPIFAKRCYRCHGPDEQENDLRLDLKARALKGGASGMVIHPGKSAESPLMHYVAGIHKNGRMPPEGEGKPLSAKQIGRLRAWIDQGATWPDDDAAIAGGRKRSDRR